MKKSTLVPFFVLTFFSYTLLYNEFEKLFGSVKMKTITAKKEKIKRNLKDKNIVNFIRSALFFLAGFVLSSSKAFGSVCPFAVSLTAVSKKKEFLYSALGGTLGYLVFCSADFARYGTAMLICTLGTLAMILAEGKNTPVMPMVISFVSLTATGVIVCVKNGAVFAEYALVLGESVLGAGGAFFFFRSLNAGFNRFRLKALPVSDLTCIIISASVILMSLSRLTIYGISPVRIIAVFAILLFCRFGSSKLGLILALAFGFAFGISGTDSIFITGAYGFSAMLAVLFVPFGSFAASIAFALSTALFSVASGAEAAGSVFIEALIGAALFSLLPPVLTAKIEAFFHDGADITPEGSLRQSLVVRLRFASGAMNYISESVNEVREKINLINEKNSLQYREILTDEEYIARETVNEKTNEIRMVASDQFFSIADMLSDLAKEFDEAEQFDNISAGKIRRLLGEYEIYPQNISVVIDKYGRMKIEILTREREPELSNPKLQSEISKACSRYFEKGRITHFKEDSMISFTEKPNFTFEIGFAQHSAEGRLCGDTIKTINDGRGRSILIISDGMGKGGRAALDGAMGAGLLSKLLSAGFGFDSSLKVVNSALLVKSNEESLATLDCACVDLFTGKTDFYKAGAPASYIVKNGSVTRCELTSMPAGILRGIEFAKRTAVLSDGDLIVMTSDGIAENETNWLGALLTGMEDAPVQEIADTVLAEAKKLAEAGHEDDMSVIAARLNRV